jgi:hypothetical protein
MSKLYIDNQTGEVKQALNLRLIEDSFDNDDLELIGLDHDCLENDFLIEGRPLGKISSDYLK